MSHGMVELYGTEAPSPALIYWVAVGQSLTAWCLSFLICMMSQLALIISESCSSTGIVIFSSWGFPNQPRMTA